MKISPKEAEEALSDIHKITRKTRHAVSSSGAYIFLIYTGLVWLAGFLGNQFLPEAQARILWAGAGLLGSVLSIVTGLRVNRHIQGPLMATYGRRLGLFWLLLVLFCTAVIAVAQPGDGKQLTMLIILFVLLGQMAMSLVFSFAYAWWTLPISLLALIGYFCVTDYFYLWMAVSVGLPMILLGLFIRWKW